MNMQILLHIDVLPGCIKMEISCMEKYPRMHVRTYVCSNLEDRDRWRWMEKKETRFLLCLSTLCLSFLRSILPSFLGKFPYGAMQSEDWEEKPASKSRSGAARQTDRQTDRHNSSLSQVTKQPRELYSLRPNFGYIPHILFLIGSTYLLEKKSGRATVEHTYAIKSYAYLYIFSSLFYFLCVLSYPDEKRTGIDMQYIHLPNGISKLEERMKRCTRMCTYRVDRRNGHRKQNGNMLACLSKPDWPTEQFTILEAQNPTNSKFQAA